MLGRAAGVRECMAKAQAGGIRKVFSPATAPKRQLFPYAGDDKAELKKGLKGEIAEIDEDGDAFVGVEGSPAW